MAAASASTRARALRYHRAARSLSRCTVSLPLISNQYPPHRARTLRHRNGALPRACCFSTALWRAARKWQQHNGIAAASAMKEGVSKRNIGGNIT